MRKTILEYFLKEINFRYTFKTIEKFMETPQRENFWGLINIMHQLGIEMVGYKLTDLADLTTIKFPSITLKNNEFIILTNLSHNLITYKKSNSVISENLIKFSEDWSHTILEVKTIRKNEEVNYKANRKQEIKDKIIKFTLIISSCLLLLSLLVYQDTIFNTVYPVLFLLNLIGFSLSILSYVEYLEIESNTSKKICKIIKNSDCSNNSKSKYSQIFKIFHLSELGISYFTTMLVSLLILQIGIDVYYYYSVASIAFCVWSISVQKFILKKWCSICISIIITLISIFLFLSLHIDYSKIFIFTVQTIIPTFILTWMFISMVCLLYFYSKWYRKFQNQKYDLNNLNLIKNNESIKQLLYLKEKTLNTIPHTNLIFGNPDSDEIITLVSNPFCVSCMADHFKINKLDIDNYRIEYVFAAFSDELTFANKGIIAYYNKYGASKTWDFISLWYADKRKDKSFFRDLDIEDSQVNHEMFRQLFWIKDENINSTPLVFYNHRKIPDVYNIDEFIISFDDFTPNNT